MENLESIWQVGGLALLAGAFIGALGYRLFAPSVTRANKIRSELEAARQELIDYRASVNKHFDKTSELVNDLTQNYVKVYRHLAEGAQALGGSRELNRLLEQQPGKVLLTVDDRAPAERTGSADQTVDTSPTPGETVATAVASEPVEPAAKTFPGETAESSAGPVEAEVSAAATDSSDSGQTGDDAAKTDATRSSVEGDARVSGPVIDVSKIEQGAANGADTETELGTLIRDSDDSEEIKPTRH